MPTPTYTNAEMLVEVRAAIFAALSNQSYSIAGRSFTRQDLSKLKDMEAHYQAAVSAESGSLRPSKARFGSAT